MAQDVEDVNLCLYCNKPCNATAIFCDECRVSLLNREHACAPTRQESSATQAEEEEQECAGEILSEVAVPLVNTVFPVSPSFPRRPVPRRMRIALIMLLIAGILSLAVDGILLAANVLRHQPLSSTSVASNAAAGIDFSRHTIAAAGHGHDASNTPISSGTSGTSTPLTPSTQTIGNRTPYPMPVTVTLTVQAPCVLQAAPFSLSFTAILLQNPPAQSIALHTSGTCSLPISWTATASASWVSFSSSSGSGDTLTISTHMNSLLGSYKAQITLAAVDSKGRNVQISPQTIGVTLTVIT